MRPQPNLQEVLRCVFYAAECRAEGKGVTRHAGWLAGEVDWTEELHRLLRGEVNFMRVLDAGHSYEVAGYDGSAPQIVRFMKREGEGYPGNKGVYGGTNCQELIRVLIDRVLYLDNQIPHAANKIVLENLRASLYAFELRAAERHGLLPLPAFSGDIELAPACEICGHIVCPGHSSSKAATL